jgi:drug/metabolite transporter (DMT)-like permease
MPLAAITLVVLSCFTHAGWNLLAKQGRQRLALFWWSTLWSVVLFAPASAAYFLISESVWPNRVWAYLACSGVSLTFYKYALARGYSAGDLSVVYPIARSAPLFVAIWATLWLHEPVDALGAAGIGMVIGGSVLVSIPPAGWRGSGPTLRAVGWAALTALCSSFYSVADRAAMLQVEGLLARLAYLHLEFAAMCLGLTLLSIPAAPWRLSALRQDLRGSVGIGILEPGTYWMILLALSMPAAPVTYVVALRQFSALIGVVLGWRLLREPRGWLRLGSAAIIVAGLVLVAGPWHR